MPSIKSCLKILFQGETNFIICENANNYEEVISQAMNRFGISEQERDALILTNGQGYVFEAHLLEYFLLLFPCPEITFHLRYDFQRLRRSHSQESQSMKRKRPTEQPDSEVEEDHEDQDQDYEPVPVYRQNCFLGSLPPSGSNRGALVHRQNSFLREKQHLEMSRLQDPPQEEDLREEQDDRKTSQSKRLRLEVCHKSRRSASSNPPPPPMRSIRI